MFALAHLSDPHLADWSVDRPSALANKRITGWLSWRLNRHKIHLARVLDLMQADMAEQPIDHVAVTGDLVNISLPQEFEGAARWLRTLGPADKVTVIPGNHDAYVAVHNDEGLGRWRDYMTDLAWERSDGTSPADTFPFVRRIGPLALIGLSSAVPTAPFFASGTLGPVQLAAVRDILTQLGSEGAFRVVLIHHPPLGKGRPRKALTDAREFCEVVRAVGAELILHGHMHKATIDHVGETPVIGVPSASALHWHHRDASAYNVYRIARWDSLPLDPRHERAGADDSMFAQFAHNPGRLPPGETVVNIGQARTLPIRLEVGDDLETGLDVLRDAFFAEQASLETQLLDPDSSDLERSLEINLLGGNDGQRPAADQYEGDEIVLGVGLATVKTGLKTFEDIEDISIVAAPGSTFGYEKGYTNDAKTIINLLIQHAQRMRYRIAVLDSGERQSISEVRALRAQIDSTYAALYYPWVRILDPVTGKENYMPPSGFVAGIYCRNDIERAVYKAPANEVVNLSIGFEQLLNKSQQDILNPEGINCFRFFEGRGFRLWGARTISSDPEWKYVNLRRYFAYLERSIDKGTQWAVFEPNGEKLWGNVRRTIEDFLLNEWMMGALLGDKPEKAFFVRCDRSTMTQNDLDNGRLVCTIGVAPLRPAEYVIFRIGQWTADRKV